VNDELAGNRQMEQCVRGVNKRYCYERVNTVENTFFAYFKGPFGVGSSQEGLVEGENVYIHRAGALIYRGSA
jgi:hypothetical protein